MLSVSASVGGGGCILCSRYVWVNVEFCVCDTYACVMMCFR